MSHLHSHFGVYALILNDDKEKVLLIKKARGPYKGLFDLPGGSPEPAELLEETLFREVMEETGCSLTGSAQLGGVSARFQYEKEGVSYLLRHLGVIYFAKISGTPKADGDGEDSNGCLWVDVKELNNTNATPFTLQALEHKNNPPSPF